MNKKSVINDSQGMLDLSKSKFVVSFISLLNPGAVGYVEAADKMIKAVEEEDGFIAAYSARNEGGVGITLSYWSSVESIAQWKANKAHKVIQTRGKNEWYDWYQLQVCEIVRSNDGGRSMAFVE